MATIIIRCDSSVSIGTGHIYRCRTLARALKARGSDIFFVCRRQTGDLISLLQEEFPVLPLPELPLKPCDGLADRDLYSSWLGCSQYQDVDDCYRAVVEANITSFDWLIVDHYGLDHIWQSRLLNYFSSGDLSPKLLVLDDLADRIHQADILLDQNFFGSSTQHRYQNLVPSRCLQLLGPKFSLLGPEYSYLHPLVPPRTELQRVLIFFGGVDNNDLTITALQALTNPIFSSLAVDVVLGRHVSRREDIVKIASQRSNTNLYNSLPSLAGLMVRADLAIGACGATTWERACLGLPSLVIPIAANQLESAQYLLNSSCIMLISNFNIAESISSAIARCLAAPGLLTELSIKSAKLVDGHGSSILSEQMLETNG